MPELIQPYPQLLADDLSRFYGQIQPLALSAINQHLVPAAELGDRTKIEAAAVIVGEELAEGELSDDNIEKAATKTATQHDDSHRTFFLTSLAGLLGISILGTDKPGDPREFHGGGDPKAPGRLRFTPTIGFSSEFFVDDFVRQNTSLVSVLRNNIPRSIADQTIRSVVLESGDPKVLTQNLLKEWKKNGVPSHLPIQRFKANGEPFKVRADLHAQFIAEDQLAKLDSDLTRLRHTSAGIVESRWKIRGDGKERDEHKALKDMIYKTAQGVRGLFPGKPPRCRCLAAGIATQEQLIAAEGFVAV